VGHIGLHHPPFRPEMEIGWLLYEGSEGQGYAVEAARAALAHAWGPAAAPSLVSYIDPGNTRSAAVAEKLGAAPDPDAPKPPDAPGAVAWRHPRPAEAPA
ncbi:MAG: GNAT family N-acetyltransferase, partial [Pseudomonadota bacterium]